MSRTRVAVALSLVLLPTLKVVAGPPNERSSAMMLDKVEDGLRRYRQQKAEDKRVEWLHRLAPSHDPRVEAVLEAAQSDPSKAVALAAIALLVLHYDWTRNVPDAPPFVPGPPAPPRLTGPPET